LRPVEVDSAEVALFGGARGGGFGGFVEEVSVVGGRRVGEDIDGFELVEVGCFDDDVPVEGVEGVGVGVDAEDFGIGDRVVCDLLGVVALDVAEAPEGDDAEQREDGPATAAKGFFACAYFGVDETEERGGEEREQQ